MWHGTEVPRDGRPDEYTLCPQKRPPFYFSNDSVNN